MGRVAVNQYAYKCDFCRVTRERHDTWWGFRKGRNVPAFLSPNLIFCTEEHARAWINRLWDWIYELNSNDMRERFPENTISFEYVVE